MTSIRLLPLAMVPLFGVPISGLIHIVMFKKLMTETSLEEEKEVILMPSIN